MASIHSPLVKRLTTTSTIILFVIVAVFACKKRGSTVANAQEETPQTGGLWDKFNACNGEERCERRAIMEGIIQLSNGEGSAASRPKGPKLKFYSQYRGADGCYYQDVVVEGQYPGGSVEPSQWCTNLVDTNNLKDKTVKAIRIGEKCRGLNATSVQGACETYAQWE
ncbi:MAG: hypothetical protein AB7T49_17890 [Oligoflexales bacterium]